MRTFLLLILAAFAQAQTPYDCQLSATFTASTLTTAPYYNLGPAAPCVSWRLTYNTQNATGVSISLQGTGNLPNGQADPAGWTNLTVTAPVTNPAIGTAAGTIAACCDYYPWIRVTAGTFTGTGQTMKLAVFGYKGTSAARTTGGGGGGPTTQTATSNIPDGTVYRNTGTTPRYVNFSWRCQTGTGDAYGMTNSTNSLVNPTNIVSLAQSAALLSWAQNSFIVLPGWYYSVTVEACTANATQFWIEWN
jgi:hypothetical protein